MNRNHTRSLSTTFIHVLEEVAMMFADEAAAHELTKPSEGCVVVSIEFSGAGRGSLKLATTRSTATEVAASILGLDTEDPEVVGGAMDALKELLNVTLGRLLTVIGGEDAVFDLSVPHAKSGLTSFEWDELLGQGGTVAVMADDYPILLNLEVQEGTALEGVVD